YSVSLAQSIIPGSDLSEQISTAGMEASGTGNMKLALNGALTIGTLDGANVEIRNEVGPDHIFIFGRTAEAIDDCRRAHFTGSQAASNSPRLMEAIKAIDDGMFSPDAPDRFKPIAAQLLAYDHFMVAADFDAYWDAQRKVDLAFVQPGWWRSA